MVELNLGVELDLAAAAAKAAKTTTPPPETDIVEQFGSGAVEGAVSMVGAFADVPEWFFDTITSGVNRLTGLNLRTRAETRELVGAAPDIGSSEQLLGLADPLISDVPPQTGPQRFARRVGEEVGAGAVVAPLGVAAAAGRRAAVLATDIAADIGSGLAAQAAQELLPDSVAAELIASLAGGVATAKGITSAADRKAYARAVKETIRDTPSVLKLKANASKLYDEAAATGLTANVDQVTKFNDSVIGIALDEGLMAPSGTVVEGFPKVKGALGLIAEFAGAEMTPTQMRRVRRTISKVAGSTDPSEARIGVKMLKSFDTFTSPLTPTIAEANRLYTQAMRGDSIDVAIELAGDRAGQFTGSGFENALRTEFRALSRKITKRQIKGLSKDQITAVKRVANGGSLDNFFRNVGKAAPTGIVSAGMAGGVPFMVGTAFGGPGVGAAAGVGALTVGGVSRRIATKRGIKNAETAAALMRGMTFPAKKQNPEAMRQVLATWLTQNAAGALPEAEPQTAPR